MNTFIIFICLILVIYIFGDAYGAFPGIISYIRDVRKRKQNIKAKLAQRFIDKIMEQQEISAAKREYKNNVAEYFKD